MVIFELLRKVLILNWRYKSNFIIGFISTTIMAFGIAYGFSSLGGDANSFIIGYIFWIMYQSISFTISSTIDNQSKTGVLEKQLTLPVDFTKLLFMYNISTLLNTIIYLIFLFSLTFLLRFKLTFSLIEPIPVFIFGTLFLFSISYIMGGLSLITKKIETISNFLNIILLATSVYAVGNYHSSLYQFFRWFPYTQAVILLKKIEVDGATFSEILPGLLPLAISSIIFFIIGIIVFKWCDRYTRIKGLLGQY